MLEISETAENSRRVVRAEGELDLAGVPGLRRAFRHPWAETEAILDLSGVTFIDSTGMEFLIEAQREAEAKGCHLVLRGISGVVRATLRISGVLPLLRVSDS